MNWRKLTIEDIYEFLKLSLSIAAVMAIAAKYDLAAITFGKSLSVGLCCGVALWLTDCVEEWADE